VPDRQHATLATRLDLGVGATVTVTLPDRYLLLGTLLVYGVPLAALLAGAVLGVTAFGSDLGAAGGAALGLAAALLAAPFLRRGLERVTLREMVVRPVSS
jgi:positive regulator of sigma E activity